VRHGNLVWEASAGDEWEVRPEDDFADLRKHTVDYSCQP